MNLALKHYAKSNFPDSKSDLFAMFIERGFEWCKSSGFNGMVTMQSWMFLSSFESMRENLLLNRTIQTMAHLGARAFGEISGEVVQTTAFVLQGQHFRGFKPVFFRLVEGREQQKAATVRSGQSRFATTIQDDFRKIPGSPIAYWVSERLRDSFLGRLPLGAMIESRVGMATGDNARFVRGWQEVNFTSIGFSLDRMEARSSKKKWFPYANGGESTKWYGNHLDVVNWENDGAILQTELHETGRIRAHNFNLDKIFVGGATWSLINANYFAVRYLPKGFSFSSGAPSLFCDAAKQHPIIGYLNSPFSASLLNAINPTVNNNSGDIDKLPYGLDDIQEGKIRLVVQEIVGLSKESWDSSEVSWDFSGHPLTSPSFIRNSLG